MTLPALIAAGLETVLNRYLQLDPAVRSPLAKLEGAVVAIEFEGLGLMLYLLPGPEGIRVLDHYVGEWTVRIRGTPWALAQQWRGQRVAGSALTFDGDAAVGRAFQTALAHLEIDWEEQWAKIIGDVAAHRLGQFWRGFGDWGHRARDTLARDGSEYLHQELRVLPPRPAVEHFLREVDTLREDADRLAARIERLRRWLTAGEQD